MKKTIRGILVLSAAIVAANAQPDQVPIEELDRSRALRERQNLISDAEMEKATPLTESELIDAGPQYLLKVKERKKYFEAVLDTQIFYTSNMFFEEQSGEDTTLFVNTIQVAVAPTAYPIGKGHFSPRLGYRHQWFNYGLGTGENNLSASDFNARTVFLDLRYRLDNWVLGAGAEWTQLLDQDRYFGFYEEWFPTWSVQRVIPVNPRLAFGVGYQGNYRFTEVDSPDSERNDRSDHSLFFGGSYAITPAFNVQPFYRYQYTLYTHDARNDFMHSLGLALQYEFNELWSVRLVLNYDNRESDDTAVPDYSKYDIGAGVNFVLRF